MPQYTIEAPDGRQVTIEGDSEPTEVDLENIFSSLPKSDVSNKTSIGNDLINDAPYLALSAAQAIPGPVGTAIDVASSAAEHPIAFAMGGPSMNKMQEGANLTGLLASLIKSNPNPMDSGSLGRFLKQREQDGEIFPSTGVTSAKTGSGQLAQLGIGLAAPLAQKAGARYAPEALPKYGPEIPKEKEVSGAIQDIEKGVKDKSDFYRTSNKLGTDVIDNIAAQKLAEIDVKRAETDKAISKQAYELSKKFRDEYYPAYSKKLTDDFGAKWDKVVGGVEVDSPDINIALVNFSKRSGLYNKAQYSPETLLPIEKKILGYVEGLRERSNGVSRMKLSELSDGFESILRNEYGKQWKTPIVDQFRRSFVDLAGDGKYDQMKAVKAEFAPKYKFREDMRPFFGKKKGEADMQKAVGLFKGWASGNLQTKNPSHAAIIEKITKEFGSNSLDSISSISKDKANFDALREAVVSEAESQKNLYSSKLLAKATEATKFGEDQTGSLKGLLEDIQKRKSGNVLNRLASYAAERFTPFSKEYKIIKNLNG